MDDLECAALMLGGNFTFADEYLEAPLHAMDLISIHHRNVLDGLTHSEVRTRHT